MTNQNKALKEIARLAVIGPIARIARAAIINEDCAWCGGEIESPFPNRRGELFCTKSHRDSSNRALKRLLTK